MEKIKSDQKNVLKEILGERWKSIPQMNEIMVHQFGVKIKDGDIIGLGLNNLKLATLPDSIGSLSSLKTLNLDFNQLTTLPESIGNLESLQKLGFSENQLTTLPESIGNLSSLQQIWLGENELKTLPGSISNLKSLKELDLEGNPLNQEFKKILKMANGDIQFILRKISENRAFKEKLKEERFVIEKLIQEAKFSEVVLKLKNINNSAQENNFREIFSWALKNLKICNEPIIKKSVLDLGTKFARLQIAEISEVCGLDDVQLIVDIVKDMIDNKEIYA